MKKAKFNKDKKKKNLKPTCVIFKMIEKSHRKQIKKTAKCYRIKPRKKELKKKKKNQASPGEPH